MQSMLPRQGLRSGTFVESHICYEVTTWKPMHLHKLEFSWASYSVGRPVELQTCCRFANCVQDLALAKPTTNNRHDYLPKNRQPQYRSQIVASFLTGRKGIPQLALNPSCKTPMKGSRFNLTATVRDQAALHFLPAAATRQLSCDLDISAAQGIPV